MYTVGAFLIRGEWSLMEKIYKTQTERIDLLVKRGMTIEESSKKILEKYSHYNLINAYKNPFLENKGNYPAAANINEDYYILGTIPEYFEALYQFDRKLRLIFLEEILIIEEKLKHAIIQSFYDVHTNYGQNKTVSETLHKENEYLRRVYYNRETFSVEEIEEKSGHRYTVTAGTEYDLATLKYMKPKKKRYTNDTVYDEIMTMIYSNIGRQRKKKAYIKKYIDEHTYLPMWVLMNIMTFGSVGKYFNIQIDEVKEKILEKFNIAGDGGLLINSVNFSRILEILGIYRNITAHNERFYCTSTSIPIDDNFMKFIDKLPYSEDVKRLAGTNHHINKTRGKKLSSVRKSIYSLMFSISIFQEADELILFKDKIKVELEKLRSSLPERSYEFIKKEMGLNFDWYNKLVK